MLFPAAVFQIYFIGRDISFPREPKQSQQTKESPSTSKAPKDAANAEPQSGAIAPVWSPPVPLGFSSEDKKILPQDWKFGVPSYYLPFSPRLSITGMKASFNDVYPQFQGTLDPYTDVFFMFHPGFGFPSLSQAETLQINSQAEWGPVLPELLETKCPIFVSGFSPADLERDVRSLETAEGVAGDFDWLITPGPNAFGSDKWDIAEFDPRVMVKTNWGIWGIRGKRRDIRERDVSF
jgi:splicing suppressor protein 51